MIRRPPRSTLDRSSAASDVYKRQALGFTGAVLILLGKGSIGFTGTSAGYIAAAAAALIWSSYSVAVSYTHLRAHETVLDLVCRLLLEKKTITTQHQINAHFSTTQLLQLI